MAVSSAKVGMVGVGAMGEPMVGHLLSAGQQVVAYDVHPDKVEAVVKQGASSADSLADLVGRVGVVLVSVRTDAQLEDVAAEVVEHGRPGQVLVVTGTHSIATVRRLGDVVTAGGLRLLDAPVVFGTSGAREGTLLSLCGGDPDLVEEVTPVLLGYSGRGVEHVGPLGAGQLAKACNNLLHWIACVGSFETLALAKRYGVDAQRMREVLLKCPGENGTLRRWDGTRFTWQEKDMDLVTTLAQEGGLVLPLAGQVDQLVKTLSASDVSALLYGDECSYLGRTVAPLATSDGGL